ncbi:MAG: site-specific DNA-methyltransferase, partial [Chloroflexi bacterium]|nr:site-specific DNA-methyltransferase [Chloroflexota bacterium]
SPAGSIYVHIGLAVEHRVRLLLDEVFGAHNFRNSITRIKCNPKNFNRNSYGNIKDTILFYSVSPRTLTWNPQRETLSEDEVERLYPLIDDWGRRYTTTPLHAPGVTRNGKTGQPWRGLDPPEGRHWRYAPEKLDELDALGRIAWSSTGNPRMIKYAEQAKGKLPQDVWEYKDPQNPIYPTQKNADMFERIILTSSNPGDTVLDCFAGSGETLLQAHRLGRRFVGMDSSAAAQTVIASRLRHIDTEWIEAHGEIGLRIFRASSQSSELVGST